MTKAREARLLFFKDAEKSEIHGVKEAEMPGHWRWNQTKQTWNLGVSEVPFDAITNHMMEFLKKCYGGVYEDSKRDREVVIQWFKTMWRVLRGGTIEYGRVHRDRSKNLKEKVQETCSRTDEIPYLLYGKK